ncbi:MAG: hypothetical protein K2W94_02900 [Alphaproteobacteria bacterium]|nr:hypothetical protein [Alphaproteobacteria bacterium]
MHKKRLVLKKFMIRTFLVCFCFCLLGFANPINASSSSGSEIEGKGNCKSRDIDECEGRAGLCFVEVAGGSQRVCRDVCFKIKKKENCKKAITTGGKNCQWGKGDRTQKDQCYDPTPPVEAVAEIAPVTCNRFKQKDVFNHSRAHDGERCEWHYSNNRRGKCYGVESEADEIAIVLSEPGGQ